MIQFHTTGTKIAHFIKDYYRDRPALGKEIVFQAGKRQFPLSKPLRTKLVLRQTPTGSVSLSLGVKQLEYKDNYSYQSAIDVKRTGAINTPPPFCAFTE